MIGSESQALRDQIDRAGDVRRIRLLTGGGKVHKPRSLRGGMKEDRRNGVREGGLIAITCLRRYRNAGTGAANVVADGCFRVAVGVRRFRCTLRGLPGKHGCRVRRTASD